MKMTGAIFDLDGTLLDSMPVWEHFGELYLETRGIAPPQGLADTLRTMSLPQSAAYFREAFGLIGTIEEILDGFRALLAWQYREKIPPKDDVLPFLLGLERAGVKMCVATATDGELARCALERLGIASRFAFILTCAEAGCGKEDPAIFQLAAQRLGTQREQTVVFEDALHAVRTAKAAGFPVVGVYDASSRGDWEQIMRLADRAIRSLKVWEGDCNV